MSLRAIALGVAIPIAVTAKAQFFSGAINAGIQAMRFHKLFPGEEQILPTQPSGNPLPPPRRSGDLPKPGPLGPDGGMLQIIYAGYGAREGDGRYIHATGKRIDKPDDVKQVEFTDRGYHCWADEIYGDTQTDTYTLTGHVRVIGQDESIYGDSVQVNFLERTFTAEDSESTLKPALVQGRLKGNLYVKAGKSYGSRREVFGESSSTTTCDYPSPHFELIAERTDVRPGKRVIFRKVKLKILGHVIVNLPFLSVPLDDRNYNNLPRFGHGTQEGYYERTRFGIPLGTGNSYLDTNLDYFTRLGLGLGGDYKYNNRDSQGLLRLYTIQGPHTEWDLALQHRQTFKWGTLSLDNSYQDNNYLVSSTSKILNSRAILFIPEGKATSDRLTFFRTSSDTPGSSALQQTVALNDTRGWTSKFRTTLDVNLSDNNSSFGVQTIHREQADVAFHAIDDLQVAQARFDYIRSIPVGESANFFNTSDVTPSLTLMSDARRLMGQKFEAKFPFTTEVSLGQYGDPITKGPITRSNFDISFQNPRSTGPKHWDVTYQGEYKQSIYSDDTAQYVLRGASQLTYNFRDKSRFNISYNYLRPYGYTPLQIDRRGQQNNIISDLSFNTFKNLFLGVATGYDFNLVKQHAETAWQQVGIQAKYTLGNYFNFRTLSTYDTTQHAFSSTRMDLTWIPGSTYISIGAKYDGLRSKWAAVNMYIDGIQTGRLRTSVLLNYNGYTNKFEAAHFSFIYDLHCAEAVFQILDNPTGFNSGRQIAFFIRLKALPFDTPFGTGSRGQAIGTGTGRD